MICENCALYRKNFAFPISHHEYHTDYHYCMSKQVYFIEKENKLYFLKPIPRDETPENQKRLANIEPRIKCWGFGDYDMVLRLFQVDDCKSFISFKRLKRILLE